MYMFTMVAYLKDIIEIGDFSFIWSWNCQRNYQPEMTDMCLFIKNGHHAN